MTTEHDTKTTGGAAGRARKPRTAGDPVTLEDKLWAAADKLRGKIPPSRYQDVVLGLVFLKYVSDAFTERRRGLHAKLDDPASDYHTSDAAMRELVLEDRDEYAMDNVPWVPADARWEKLQSSAKLAYIGELIDNAMDAVERENPSLRGVLPKIYASAGIPPRVLGGLIDTFSGIEFDAGSRAHDVLGRVYEYFLNRFGINYGGEHYTPRPIVRLLVSMIEPFKGRVYDPCCGSGGMFVQSRRFVEEHGGSNTDMSVFGQEAVLDTWRLAKMNLAIRGIDANLGDRNADSFHEDLQPDLRADFLLANPPFNDSDWDGELLRDDPRWVYGVPPATNANYAWVQHFIYHLAPDGIAGFVLANGALSSWQNGEGDIRRRIIEAGLVDSIVSLPTQLFYKTSIPVSLWFVAKARAGGRGLRERRNEVLFVDAHNIGRMATRTVRTFDETDIQRIVTAYHGWRSESGGYVDVPGFCQSVALDRLKANDWVLNPARYVGSESADEDESRRLAARFTDLVAEALVELDNGEALRGLVRATLDEVQRG
ncbi:MAG: class I SAM-dependent DNA methyltransferase [Isosphaeraceae bacterium]|nr:class I SAM-dependent DNA methyltransferase [Isosphaeraceae bacterium]